MNRILSLTGRLVLATTIAVSAAAQPNPAPAVAHRAGNPPDDPKGEHSASVQSWSISAGAPGLPIHPGVRGVALADSTLERGSWRHGIPDSLAVANGSAIRGVAGGLYADLYDWRTRVSSFHGSYSDATQPRPPTLEFLRWSRDHRAELFITVNTRGLVRYDRANAGKVRYCTSDTLTLARLAADWVHYANHIAPRYHQGDAPSNPRDRDILNSLVWKSAAPGDAFDTLASPTEAPLQPVRYWEIGNEPTVRVSGGIGVSNGFTLGPEDYAARYKAIAAAMKAEDPAIRVGPCVVNGSGRNAVYLTTLASDPGIPIDFIAYHPYQKLGNRSDAEKASTYLGKVFTSQQERLKDIREAVAAGGRDPETIEWVASEVNVSDWKYNETIKEAEMAHALGTVETVFAFARLGLVAAHYWIWPADAEDGTRYPVYLAYEKLRDRLGDRLLGVFSIDDRARVYATRDSATGTVALWGLNFQNGRSETVVVSLMGLHGRRTARRLVLGNTRGATTLTSGNYSPRHPGGQRHDVDWVESPLPIFDTAHLPLTLDPATLTVVLIEHDANPMGSRKDE